MANQPLGSSRTRISGVVQGMLAKRAIQNPAISTSDLREAGLTSLDMVNLMLAVEAEFDVEIPTGEMTPENFRSIDTIDALISTLAPGA